MEEFKQRIDDVVSRSISSESINNMHRAFDIEQETEYLDNLSPEEATQEEKAAISNPGTGNDAEATESAKLFLRNIGHQATPKVT